MSDDKKSHPPRWREHAPDYIKKAHNDEFLKSMVRRWVEEQLWCPSCGHLCDLEPRDDGHDNDDRGNLVTLHGDDGIMDCTCEHCGAAFKVNEDVRRTFHTAHTWEDACSPRPLDIDMSFGEEDEYAPWVDALTIVVTECKRRASSIMQPPMSVGNFEGNHLRKILDKATIADHYKFLSWCSRIKLVRKCSGDGWEFDMGKLIALEKRASEGAE